MKIDISLLIQKFSASDVRITGNDPGFSCCLYYVVIFVVVMLDKAFCYKMLFFETSQTPWFSKVLLLRDPEVSAFTASS